MICPKSQTVENLGAPFMFGFHFSLQKLQNGFEHVSVD